ncbi:hypothetical protein KKF91_03250 [Myxococcota bacterium]|nr:hypothetical protein [Myxococcota bacterium]MBU1429558.1 hypothetical protein [Myxococcota bacterium]MBU1900369.1 hypothetical protein [Myxococcota bacterium]
MSEFDAAYRAWARRLPRFCEAPAITRARAYASTVGGWARHAAALEARWGFSPPSHLREARAFFAGADAFTLDALRAGQITPLAPLWGDEVEPPRGALRPLLRIEAARLGVGPQGEAVWRWRGDEPAEICATALLEALVTALAAPPWALDEASFLRRWAIEAIQAVAPRVSS